MKLMPWDELNSLQTVLETELKQSLQKRPNKKDIGGDYITYLMDTTGHIEPPETAESESVRNEPLIDPDKAVSTVEDILIVSYLNGTADGNEMLESSFKADSSKMRDSVYRKVKDEDFSERVREYAKGGKTDEIMRVAETESHRVYNDAISDIGREGKAKTKKWVTMMDGRVRDTHDYLEGMVVPFEDDFYTFDGDHAFAPGGFEDPGNNCGCRCLLKLGR